MQSIVKPGNCWCPRVFNQNPDIKRSFQPFDHLCGGMRKCRKAYGRRDWRRRGGTRNMESERMPEEWRASVLIPIFKNKGDVQSFSNYRGITLISHTMKLWERVVERRLRSELPFSEQQYGFIVCFESVDGEVQLKKVRRTWRKLMTRCQEKRCGIAWESQDWQRSTWE